MRRTRSHRDCAGAAWWSVFGEFGEATESDADGNAIGYRVWTPDGSLARVAGTKVEQSGSLKLWDTLERAHGWFTSHGHLSRDRFGATITRDEQSCWLDGPWNGLPRPIGNG